MANTQSAYILKAQGSPKNISKHDAGVGHATVTTAGTVEFTPSSANDTCELVRLPAFAKIHRLELATDDLASTSCTLNLGLYEVGEGTSAGTVIDADCLATAIDVGTAATAMTDYRYEVLDINTANLPLWDLATGYTEAEALEDGEVTLALTVAAVTGGVAGTVSWRIEYSL